MRYAVVYEQTPSNYSAYVPDLPGCIATGQTREQVEARVREAIRLHVNLMRRSGEKIPPATTAVGSVDADI